MKILFISENYPPYIEGGAEISTSLLANWLVRNNNSVAVACSEFAERPWSENGVDVYPVILKVSVGAKNALSSVRYAFGIVFLPIVSAVRILRLIRKLRPDVVNIVVTLYTFVPMLLIVRVFSRRPMFIDCRDYSLICPAQFRGNELEDPKHSRHGYRCLRKAYATSGRFLSFFAAPFALYESCVFNFYKSLLRYAVNRFPGLTLVANSRYIQSQLVLNGFRVEKTVVIYNISQKIPGNEEVTKAPIPTFVYAGRIEKEKGIWDVVAAAELLQTETEAPFCIQIAGRGSEFDTLREYVEKNKITCITLLGLIKPEKVLTLYKEAWAIIAPSRWPEPFGRFVLESISVGTPAIATNTGGTPEGIENGVTGMLIDSESPRQLATAMKSFIEDPARSRAMGIALSRKKNDYDANDIGRARLQLYQGIKDTNSVGL